MMNASAFIAEAYGGAVRTAADSGVPHATGSAEVIGSSAVPAGDAFIEQLLLYAIDVGIFTIAVAILLCLARIIKGPDLADRGVASDTVAVQVAGLVLLITIRIESLVMFDAVLIVSILGFVSTLAFAQFIGRRRSVLLQHDREGHGGNSGGHAAAEPAS